MIEYDEAPKADVHVRSTVVTCGLLATRLVTAGDSVYVDDEDAVPPDPLGFDA